MTVETNAIFISELNKSYPRNRDLIKEGDDHIRLVKSVLQNTFPGMNGAVTASTEKLNKISETMQYDGDSVTFNSKLTIGNNKGLDFGGNVVKNGGDPVDPTDLVTLQYIQGSTMWPVGSIFMTVDSRDPSIILGFGAWEKFAAGRVLVGSGTTTDINNETRVTLNESKGGSYATTLKSENLPPHKHSLVGSKTKTDGEHYHEFEQLQIAGPSPDTKHNSNIAQFNLATYRTKTDGAHFHELEGDTALFGESKSFDNIPPYISCNIWKRNS